jgi:hypothetical protein
MNRNRCLSLFIALLFCAWTSSAFAVVSSYYAFLDGPSESPANSSAGTGFATVDYDNVAHTLAVHVDFQGLTGTVTASHIHAPTPVPLAMTAGVATTSPTFAGFPSGVTSGSYTNILDLTLAGSYNNPSYINANGGTPASAEVALTSAIAAGKAYWNIHTSFIGGGEIRGFLLPVPEPATCALFMLGAIGLCSTVRRRRS